MNKRTMYKAALASLMLLTLATSNPTTTLTANAAISTSVTLKPSSVYNSSTVWLQKNLTRLGYDSKGFDGKYGSNTKNAVIAFQKEKHLDPDGIAGPKTISALNAECEKLQRALNYIGYGNNLTIDGLLGDATVLAINRVKSSSFDMNPNGIADKDFRDKLYSWQGPTWQGVTGQYSKVTNLNELKANARSWRKPIDSNAAKPALGTMGEFGWRRVNKYGTIVRRHAGLDFKIAAGTPVYAMQSGRVVQITEAFMDGKKEIKAVAIMHDDGSIARYCEISSSLAVNKYVTKGERIGTVITTNGGQMLHLEMYLGTEGLPSKVSFRNDSNTTYPYLTAEDLATTQISTSSPLYKKFMRRKDLVNPEFLINILY